MFERTVTFWRQLLKSKPASYAGGTLVEEDRRSAARYAADRSICFEFAGAENRRCSGQLRNISTGGLNFSATGQFKTGDLLSVHVPNGEEQNGKKALAYVVHVQPEAEGRTTVGCTFARRLDWEDLGSVADQDDDLEMDKRSRPRYSCKLNAAYQPVSAPDSQPIPVTILNISTTGIAILSESALAPGELINVELTPDADENSVSILSCVVHVIPQDGSWSVGCNYISELKESDLKSLLD